MDMQTKSLNDFIEIAQRRRVPMLVIGLLILGLGSLIAFAIPAVYRSTATILIEEQEIPSDLVRSAITTYADQRIETIKQQVMSRATLWKIVEQYDLYKGIRKTSPTESVLQRFTKDVQIDVINAKVVDKRSQTPTQATIAFTLVYDGESPEIAQKVSNELTSLFLGANLKSRERHAQETTAFLKQEAESLSRHIEEMESRISTFKQKANGALPELVQLNMQLLNQSDRELMDLDREIRTLEERKTYLEGEIATIKPNTPIMSVTGERILDSTERLRTLRAQYTGASANLAPEHPDIVKMKQEIEALEKETGLLPEIEEASKQLVDARASLATVSERLGTEHPDVVQARRKIAALEQEARRLTAVPHKSPTLRPENPAYINIQAQLNSTTSTLEALKPTRKEVKRRAMEYAQRLETTPQMEPEYMDLIRDRDGATKKYEEIRSRLLEAQVSEGLEVQRKGERFSLIDPPGLPEKPEKPNRPVLLLLSLILAIAGGIGTGATLETLDHSIRTPEQLAQLTKLFPLAVIPFMPNEEDLSRAVKHRRLMKGAGVGAFVTVLALLHLFVVPLDVLWFAALRRFGIE